MEEEFITKIKKEIKELKTIQQIMMVKNPTYPFLDPVINNVMISMVDLILYLEGGNPYFKNPTKEFSNYRQIGMHRIFFSELHIAVEEGLRNMVKDQNFQVKINKQELAKNIVECIKQKLKCISLIILPEMNKIIRLAGKSPTFNDYLNAVLDNIPSLETKYKLEVRIYFDALNIIRNKISHSNMELSELEKTKLIRAKFKNAITPDGQLQMTFEGYKFLINDVIHFFDNLNAHLN